LDEVIVRSDLQTEHAIEFLFARRDEDDGQPLGSCPQSATQVEAVHARYADVEDDQIRAIAFQRFPGCQAIIECLRLVALAAECIANAFANRLFVFHDGHAPLSRSRHCQTLYRGSRRGLLPLFRHNSPRKWSAAVMRTPSSAGLRQDGRRKPEERRPNKKPPPYFLLPSSVFRLFSIRTPCCSSC
jgi:hypothetical protein